MVLQVHFGMLLELCSIFLFSPCSPFILKPGLRVPKHIYRWVPSLKEHLIIDQNRSKYLLNSPQWQNVTQYIYIIIIIIFHLEIFSHQLTLMVFYWSLSESKSPQVSRTLLSILTDLNNVVVWTVYTHPFISLQSLYQSFGDYAKNTNYNWYNCHFHVPHFFFKFPS